eukprot:TRINITY_DN382_c0_g1_i1.p1 TRINITY_DN382_c0_g1~~TRINITY_DN382_c0_g1_i1.p1  ORF type:complete len:149 (-),score=33.69 TRINITY_DN382_c0_g1_i1:110-556(-)
MIPKAINVLGRWRPNPKFEVVKEAQKLERNHLLPRDLSVHKPAPRKAKEIVKAKKRHDLVAVAEKAKKYPPLIAEMKRQKIVDRLETKRGFNLYRPSWQEQVARQRRRQEILKNDITRPKDLNSVSSIFQNKILRYYTLPSHSFMGIR